MQLKKFVMISNDAFSINLGPSGSIDQKVAGSCQGFLSKILDQEIAGVPKPGSPGGQPWCWQGCATASAI